MAGKKPINKTTNINIRLSEADKQMIQEKAAAAGLSVTDYIIRLVIMDK